MFRPHEMAETQKKPKSSRSAADVVYGVLGAVVPSCSTALRLVETGQQRPLTLRERFVLKYNSPLCLHCNCNRDKYDKELERMRTIERRRRGH